MLPYIAFSMMVFGAFSTSCLLASYIVATRFDELHSRDLVHQEIRETLQSVAQVTRRY